MSQYEQYHISIPCASRVQPHAQLPPPDLLNGTSEDYNEICLPLYKASITGNTMAAKVILGKRPELTPIYMAALCGKRGMVNFLYKESQQMTGEVWTTENRGLVFVKCVEANLFDVALQMNYFGDAESRALIQKLIDEDKGRQNAILDLALQFENSCTAKDDLRNTYEKYNVISQKNRALIQFLKRRF
nr:ankyrin repeat-containing protein [Tanacetum cinerariifolium]